MDLKCPECNSPIQAKLSKSVLKNKALNKIIGPGSRSIQYATPRTISWDCTSKTCGQYKGRPVPDNRSRSQKIRDANRGIVERAMKELGKNFSLKYLTFRRRQMNLEKQELMTDEEIEHLMMMVLKFHHQNPLTEDEMSEQLAQVTEWASKARRDSLMLNMVMNDGIAVGLNKDGKLAFRALTAEEIKEKPKMIFDEEKEDPSESWKSGNYDPSEAFSNQ